MQPVRDRPTAAFPDSKKRREESKVIVEYALFEKTLACLKSAEALNNFVVRWPSKHFVSINVPSNWFYSTCFKAPARSSNHSFVYFYNGDKVKESEIILAVRANPTTKTGEILHLKKTDAMGGTEALKLAITILAKLKAERKYLNDASYFEFEGGARLLMRVFVPMVSPDGKSWYGKYDFYPLLCRNLEGARNMDAETEEERKAPIYNQDPNFYREAINFMRAMPVAVLINEVITQPKDKEELMSIAEAYPVATVHQLAKAIFDSDKGLFVKFYNIALTLPQAGEAGTLNRVRYYLALDCLYSTKIFEHGGQVSPFAIPDFDEMTSKLPGKIVSYNTFITKASQ